MRERPSLPADVTVSELLYMLAIRAPRQGESEGGEERGGKEGRRRGEGEERMTVGKSGRKRWLEGERRGSVCAGGRKK